TRLLAVEVPEPTVTVADFLAVARPRNVFFAFRADIGIGAVILKSRHRTFVDHFIRISDVPKIEIVDDISGIICPHSSRQWQRAILVFAANINF
ncbi:hypothetical protein PFISCL1PPCAC_26141, partial [Pristionchus fissidentatus]